MENPENNNIPQGNRSSGFSRRSFVKKTALSAAAITVLGQGDGMAGGFWSWLGSKLLSAVNYHEAVWNLNGNPVICTVCNRESNYSPPQTEIHVLSWSF